MSSETDLPHLEQVTFSRGQRLTAADLNEAQRMLREMRWLHNRSLHDWGIVLGLAVGGRQGDAEVAITPGYALDCLGREIILVDPQTQIVPGVSGDEGGNPDSFLLVISYPDAKQIITTESRDGVCSPGGSVRQDAPPQIRWLRGGVYEHGLDIILAQAWVQNCRLARPLSFKLRRSVSIGCRPFVASGQTDPDNTNWVLMTASPQVIGLSTEVDTSAAHFRVTPVYQAQVMGKRWVDKPAAAIAGWSHIEAPMPDRFRLNMMLPHGFVGRSNRSAISLNPQQALLKNAPQTLGWYVVWIGVEET